MKVRLLAVAALCLACASPLASQSARTLAKGRGQLGFELHQQAFTRRTSFSTYPMAGVSARYGATDRVELGGRFGPSGLEAQVKVQLTPVGSGTAVSLAPFAGWSGFDVNGLQLGSVNMGLPVLIGIPVAKDTELVLGPRLHDMMVYGQSGTNNMTIHLISAGASVGLLIEQTPSFIMPELAVLAPVSTTTLRPDASGGWAWGTGRWTMQAGVALLLGGGKTK